MPAATATASWTALAQRLLVAAVAAAVSIPPPGTQALNPLNAEALTVYHLTPLSVALRSGGVPVDMDTATDGGDCYFDLIESMLQPLSCPPDGPQGPMCKNQEVNASDGLVVTRLTALVNPDFGPYAFCNINKAGNYECVKGAPNSVGFYNLTERDASPARWNASCNATDPEWYCWQRRVLFKTAPPQVEHKINWFSTENRSMCPAGRSASPTAECPLLPPQRNSVAVFSPDAVVARVHNVSSPEHCCSLCSRPNATATATASNDGDCRAWSYNQLTGNCNLSSLPAVAVHNGTEGTSFSSAPLCAWRVRTVDKMINATCHSQQFAAAVERAASADDKACFAACGGVPGASRNTSDPCWVRCFYATVMGPTAARPNGTLEGGIAWDALVAMWRAPLEANSTACPDVRQGVAVARPRSLS